MPRLRTSVSGLGIAVLLSTMLAMPASATHDPAAELEPCTGLGYEGTFVCGLVIVNLLPNIDDIQPVLDACPPAPEFVPEPVISDTPFTEGQRIYALHVPVGAEIELRDCYLEQDGVADAVLGGLGELTPSTAAEPPGTPFGPLGWSLLGLGAPVAIRRFLIGRSRVANGT